MTDSLETFGAEESLGDHRRTFESFGRLVLFAIMHTGLTLACLALAFLAQIPLLALVLWIGGTLAMIVVFTVMANYGSAR